MNRNGFGCLAYMGQSMHVDGGAYNSRLISLAAIVHHMSVFTAHICPSKSSNEDACCCWWARLKRPPPPKTIRCEIISANSFILPGFSVSIHKNLHNDWFRHIFYGHVKDTHVSFSLCVCRQPHPNPVIFSKLDLNISHFAACHFVIELLFRFSFWWN